MQAVDTTPLQSVRIEHGVSVDAVAAAAGLEPRQIVALETGDASAFPDDANMIAAAIAYGAALGIQREEAVQLLRQTVAAGTSEPVTTAATTRSDDGELDLAAEEALAEAAWGTSVTPSYASVRVGSRQERRFVRSDAADSDDAAATTGTEAVPPVTGPVHATLAAAAGVGALNLATSPMTWSATVVDAETTGAIPIQPLSTDEEDFASSVWDDLPEDDVVARARAADPVFGSVLDDTSDEFEAWAATAPGVRPSWLGTQIRRNGSKVLGGPERAHSVAAGVDRAAATAAYGMRRFRGWLEESSYGTLLLAGAMGIALISLLVVVSGIAGGDEAAAPESTAAKPAAAAAPAEPAAAAKAAKQAPMKDRGDLTVDVLNSGSVTGKAKAEAAKLIVKGYTVRDTGNSSRIYPQPVVLYAPGHKREAIRMGKDIGISTVDQLNTLRGGRVKLIAVIK